MLERVELVTAGCAYGVPYGCVVSRGSPEWPDCSFLGLVLDLES